MPILIGLFVLVALGWGLFWSAILSNALTAAVLAICCMVMTMWVPFAGIDEVFQGRSVSISIAVLYQLFVFLGTAIASIMIFAETLRWKRLQFEFRSPIVVNVAEPTSSRQVQFQSPVAAVLAPRPLTGMNEALVTDQPPRRSWTIEARALAWQTMKEGGNTWRLLAVMGLSLLLMIILGWGPNVGFEWTLLINIGIALVAGASVFGLENRRRTQRFLTHHGARPKLVWLAKLATWAMGLAAIWGPFFIVGVIMIWSRSASGPNWLFGNVRLRPSDTWIPAISSILLFFSVALLCGMTIRRGITAVLIAVVIGVGLTIPLSMLVASDMMPMPGLLVIPTGLLLVSLAWSSDWLLDRPAPGRWVRLGLLLTGMFSLAVGWYAGYRAWSIRDVGRIAVPAAWIEVASAPLPADQNAADLYRKAGNRLIGPVEDSPKFLEQNQETCDLVRRATARLGCRFRLPEKMTILDRPDLPPLGQLAHLLALDSSERQAHGDLTGAWDDIMALFRMAHHISDGFGLWAFSSSATVERMALGRALEWAVARGQTPDRLHSALVAFRELPKMPSAVDSIRIEAEQIENTLDLPKSRLREWAFEEMVKGSSSPTERAFASTLFDLATTPWERVRARRVNRLISTAAIEDAMLEPWERSRGLNTEIQHARKTSRNAMTLMRSPESHVFASDYNELGRRALVQIMAIRAWQLRHGGRFPKNLGALVPAELPELPNDPYSGHPFGYVQSTDQDVPALRHAFVPSSGNGQAAVPGSWLLYSVGPNGQDDGGKTFNEKNKRSQPLDIVFAIPPVEGDVGASKDQGNGKDEKKDQPAVASPATLPSPGP